MTWPELGVPLVRLEDAYVPPEKWSLWILAEEHHGPHWRRVFGSLDAERLWVAITAAAITQPITLIRDLGPFGRTCRVPMRLTLNDRTATVLTVWHYDFADAPPRLVTAYPTT